MINKKIYIWDLDGTLFNIDERIRVSTKENGKLDYKKLYSKELIKTDKPIPDMINRYKELKEHGFRMVIFSGRCISTMKETIENLQKHGIFFDILTMRPTKPPEKYTPAYLLKKVWFYEELTEKSRDNVIGAYDDSKEVVDMWRDLGIPCFHVGVDKQFI